MTAVKLSWSTYTHTHTESVEIFISILKVNKLYIFIQLRNIFQFNIYHYTVYNVDMVDTAIENV